MKKLLLILIFPLTLLAACAGPSSSGASADSSSPSSRSGVDFYGTVDVGVGVERISN